MLIGIKGSEMWDYEPLEISFEPGENIEITSLTVKEANNMYRPKPQ